jgi:hypothetical protein
MRIPKQSESVSRRPSALEVKEAKGVTPATCPYQGIEYNTGATICVGRRELACDGNLWAPTQSYC